MTPAEWGRMADWWMDYVVVPVFSTIAVVWFGLVAFALTLWLLTEVVP